MVPKTAARADFFDGKVALQEKPCGVFEAARINPLRWRLAEGLFPFAAQMTRRYVCGLQQQRPAGAQTLVIGHYSYGALHPVGARFGGFGARCDIGDFPPKAAKFKRRL